MAYAGLDIGTSSCKMVVYDVEGNSLLKVLRDYQESGTDGYRELNPEEVLIKVKEVLKEAGEKCGEQILGMAITSLGESIVCLDEMGKSLCNSMVTGDRRGMEELAEIENTLPKEEILAITGLPPSEMYGLPKYRWLNRHTNAIREAKNIFFFEDYIGYILTGKRMVSYSSASRSMAFDINKNKCQLRYCTWYNFI